MDNRPEYLKDVEIFMKNTKTIELKELFVKLRRKHPEIKSMRTMKEDILTYMDNFTVNQKDMIINKALFIEEMLGFMAAN